MRAPWIYRIGLSQSEATEEQLKKLGFKYELVEVEQALRAHIDETLGKTYKLKTSMREDAPGFFSCSSLVSYLYLFAGVWMPSVVVDKFFYFKPIQKTDLRFGDIVFAYNEDVSGQNMPRSKSFDYMPGKLTTDKKMNHMGMYLGDGQILQAAGHWYVGKVIIEKLDESPSFKNIVAYGRVVDDLKEKRWVVEIPNDRVDIRNKESLINAMIS